MNIKSKALKAAFPYTVPVLMGYLFMGAAFGVMMAGKGYNFLWAALMSICIYAGAMQYMAVSFFAAGFNIISIILISLTVNVRQIFYGLSMLDRFKGMGKKKPYMIFSLTDETFSLLCSVKVPQDINKGWFFFFIACLNHSYWIIGCTLGAILGTVCSFNDKGIDFAMTALFVVILIEQWKTNKNHLPALIGIFSSIICLLIFGSANFILPAMMIMLLLLALCKQKCDTNEELECNPCKEEQFEQVEQEEIAHANKY